MMTPKTPDNRPGAGDRPRYAVDWAHREGAVDEVLGQLSVLRSRQRHRRLTLIGGISVLLLAAVLAGRPFFPRQATPVLPALASGTAHVSLPERQVLPDGSVVELKDGAQIQVAFTAVASGPRRVKLQRGEAHFDVQKDKDRPFIVVASGVEVRAVGTAFSVELSKSEVEVVVNEGRVAVDQSIPQLSEVASISAPAAITVDAGSRVVVPVRSSAPDHLAAIAVSPAEMTERMAWRQPKLEFSGTALSEAIAMFNEHNEVKFELADPSLGDLQVSGFLRADKTETFVLLVETDFGLKADRVSPKEIVLRRP